MIETIERILSLASAIWELANTVKANKDKSRRIAERIKVIARHLEQLEQVPDNQTFKQDLQNFWQLLQEIHDFIEQFSNQRWYKKILKGHANRDEFEDYNRRLAETLPQLQLGIQAQQLFNRDQDREDQQKDLQALQDNQTEMTRLTEEEVARLKALSAQQDHFSAQQDHFSAQQDHFSAQLQSWEFYMARLSQSTVDQSDRPGEAEIPPHLEIPYYELGFEEELERHGMAYSSRGMWQHQLVIIKRLANQSDPQLRRLFLADAKRMSELRHFNIVRVFGVSSGKGCLSTIMEYVEKGSLQDNWDEVRQLSAEKKHQIVLDIAHGVAYLHQRGIIHGNINPRKILLTRDFHAKVTDFGLRETRTEYVLVSGIPPEVDRMILENRAPELLQRGASIMPACDVYSIAKMMTLIFATSGTDVEILEPYQTLMRRMQQNDPQQRPTMREVCDALEQHRPRPETPPTALYERARTLVQSGHESEARQALERAARQNHLPSIGKLGLFWKTGKGGPQNTETAKEYLQRAANGGEIHAQINLAVMLEHGDGVPQDLPLALHWYQQAQAQGSLQASECATDLQHRLAL